VGRADPFLPSPSPLLQEDRLAAGSPRAPVCQVDDTPVGVLDHPEPAWHGK